MSERDLAKISEAKALAKVSTYHAVVVVLDILHQNLQTVVSKFHFLLDIFASREM
jgi:hypothetical protein